MRPVAELSDETLFDDGKEKVEQNLDILALIKRNLENTAAIRSTLMDE